MRKFTSICFDKATGAEMILYDCSYNAACMFLEGENRNNCFGEYKGTENSSLYVTKILYENATFLYDEERGVLMRRE